MKKIMFTFSLFLCGVVVYAQHHDFKILIGLNVNDCINCYNNGLNTIDQNADSVDVILVMGKEYEEDSAKIIHKYNLRGITKHIVWSDSLMSVLCPTGRSAIVFTSKYHTLAYRYDLEGLPDSMASYLHRAGKPMDTLFTNYHHVALGTHGIYVHYSNVFFINSIFDEVNGYNLITGKRILHFSIPDSVSDQIFHYSGMSRSQRKLQQKILRQAHTTPLSIRSLCFGGRDTMFLSVVNYYFTVNRGDTILRSDNNILKLVRGNIVGVVHVPIPFNNPLDGHRRYWPASDISMTRNDGYMYFPMYPDTHPKGSRKPYNYYVLGAFKQQKDNTYTFNHQNPTKNPSIYKYATPCIFPVFSNGYFIFPLMDSLYSVSGKLPPIALNFIPAKYKYPTAVARCDSGVYINALKVSKDYVWVAFSYITKGYETVVKHNRHTGKNEFSTKGILFKNQIYANFDPIDPDFLLFNRPNKNGEIYRIKMF